MRKILFLASHLGSGSDVLFDILQSHPRIDGFRTEVSYDHYDKFLALTQNIHKRDNSSAIFMTELLHNKSFSCKALLPYCSFIYLFREPKPSIHWIVKHKGYSPEIAVRYYCYRLQGMYEYICRNPKVVVLTWDDIKKGNLGKVEKYLGLREPLEVRQVEDDISIDVTKECEECYERYLYYLRELMV